MISCARIWIFSVIIWVVPVCGLSGIAHADLPVDLELVLAIDSSASVDADEFASQLGGLAKAFRSADLLRAITSGAHGRVAVALVEWSSADRQRLNIPWRLIADRASAEALAKDIETAPRLVETGATSISSAIVFALAQFEANAFEAPRRVIDISGDGENNHGAKLKGARQAADALGVTVNALAIENEVVGLSAYFRQQVIAGPGAFAERARDYVDYVEAIQRKLLREIGPVPIS
ncbi:MAG: DUF1194 domain-containing protein [Rhodospirillaceae bacterium]|nr:DUF1194 domain-containing protein [Rhodospirillaceae bacterium]